MRRIICDECKRFYDYDKEEFCPRCGAYNPPVRTWSTDSQGNVVRVDGVNERTHAGSFVHREVHREKSIRKAVGLDWTRKAQPVPRQPAKQQAAKPLPRQPQRPRAAQRQTTSDKLKAFFVILGLILLFNLILPLLFALM